MITKPRVGVSACLVGRDVRYDGGHRKEDVLDRLSAFLDFVPICPEVEIGLGTPRPRIDLHATSDPLRPRMIQEGTDLTGRMESYAHRRLTEDSFCGYLFKARSPSCGIRGVRLFDRDGEIREVGVGVFARIFMERFSSAVVFDENILADPYGLESMVSAVFTVHRYRWAAQDAARSGEPNSADALLRCHRRHRVLLAARVDTDEDRPDPADLRGGPEERARYARSLARLLERPATRDGHRRALLLLLDELESLLPPGGRERREVMAVSQHLVHSYSEAADLHDTLIGIAELAALHAPALLDDLYLRPHPPELDLYRDL